MGNDKYAINDRVYNPKWGDGSVIGIEGESVAVDWDCLQDVPGMGSIHIHHASYLEFAQSDDV
jgi:hypothetical protein